MGKPLFPVPRNCPHWRPGSRCASTGGDCTNGSIPTCPEAVVRLQRDLAEATQLVAQMRGPLTLNHTPILGGGPKADSVIRHNAYVCGWQDGCDGCYLMRDEAWIITGPEWIRAAYQRGYETGKALRAQAFEVARGLGEGAEVGAAAPDPRDPDNPCDEFEPMEPGHHETGTCETDGHYRCKECRHREPQDVTATEARDA